MDSVPGYMLTQNVTRGRFLVVFMLFVTVVINYLDRANMSVAAPGLKTQFGLDAHHLGFILSAFGWTYVLFQIPGGLLVDRVNPRIFYAAIIGLWSITTLLIGFSVGITALFLLRMLVGAFEAPSYPMNNRIVTFWMPERERASSIATYTSGQYVGLAFLTPVLALIESRFGWQGIFVATGMIGLGWAAIWFALYRDPREARRVGEAELSYIRAHGGLVETGAARMRVSRADFTAVLSHRKLWGLYIGQFCLTSTQWFFLTWFPTYLVHYRHMDFIKAGFFGSLPFIAAFCGVLCGGVFSDFLLKRGASLGVARRTPIIAGFLLSTTIIGANYAGSTALVIGFLALAFFGNGFASQTWSLVSAMAPRRLIGLTGGVFNVFGNLPGIIVPLVIGFLIQGGDFAPALRYIAAIAVVGAFAYLFLVGRVERIDEAASIVA
jgi:ACS family D-galactonate transporter-like MFS transporter